MNRLRARFQQSIAASTLARSRITLAVACAIIAGWIAVFLVDPTGAWIHEQLFRLAPGSPFVLRVLVASAPVIGAFCIVAIHLTARSLWRRLGLCRSCGHAIVERGRLCPECGHGPGFDEGDDLLRPF